MYAFLYNNTLSSLQVEDVRKLLASSLGSLSSRHPGRLSSIVSQLEPNAQQCLNQYLQAAGVSVQ